MKTFLAFTTGLLSGFVATCAGIVYMADLCKEKKED